MITREQLSQTNLLRAQAICIHEVMQVVLIHKYKNLIFTSFYIMIPGLESFNNYKKLVIMGLISYLYQNHLFIQKSHWMALAQVI